MQYFEAETENVFILKSMMHLYSLLIDLSMAGTL